MFALRLGIGNTADGVAHLFLQRPKVSPLCTQDEQAMNDVRKYLKLIRQETYNQLILWRAELGYHTPIQDGSQSE